MIKNINIYTVRAEYGTVEELVQCFVKSAEIVFIVRENEKEELKLIGAVTEGDIKRFLRNIEKISFNELINTQIRYIVYNNEKQIYKDAEKIFNISQKINNIPVVDKLGQLLFQIDRYERNINELQAINNILEACANGSMELLLKDGTKEIIITGGTRNSLFQAKKIIYQNNKILIIENEITIQIIENIDKDFTADNKIKVISLSYLSFIYLYNIKKIKADIITTHEIVSFFKLKSIYNIDKKIVKNFMDVFKYKAIAFYPINKNICLFMEVLKSYGLKIYNLYNGYLHIKNRCKYMTSPLDIFLVSGDKEEYIEKIIATDLMQIFYYIKRYKQLGREELEYNIFMKKCIDYILDMQQSGIKGFLHIPASLWSIELQDNIKSKTNLEVIKKWDDMVSGNKYFIDGASFNRNNPGCETKPVKEHFLQYICEQALYNRIKDKCENIYICTNYFCNNDSCNNQKNNERNRENFLNNEDLFIENFTDIICGKGKEYLYEVIQNKAECSIVKLNDNYCKFSSNYHSVYFNTDLYGNRIVSNTPKEYTGTIYLIGNCIFSGYAVEDKHTIASYLQLFINTSGYKYKVENLSCDGMEFSLDDKILEKNINKNDIIIIQTKTFFQSHELIAIDYNEIDNSLQENIWFWDIPAHMGYSGYKFMANKIFNKIKPVMYKNKNYFKYKFYLNINLEHKINKYINNIQTFIKEKDMLKPIMCKKGTNNDKNKLKTGAIVMNCNPFTYGHQYLIDTASRLVDILYIFVVEEDKSVFPFEKRFAMVKEGTNEYENIIVVPSGNFMISAVTFPGYFMKDAPTGQSYDNFLDLKIFAHYIAPEFGIDTRFVGEEPFDKVTAQYNRDMKTILKEEGITVVEIPRKKYGNEFISATKVRKLIDKKDYSALKNYLPETTIQKLMV